MTSGIGRRTLGLATLAGLLLKQAPAWSKDPPESGLIRLVFAGRYEEAAGLMASGTATSVPPRNDRVEDDLSVLFATAQLHMVRREVAVARVLIADGLARLNKLKKPLAYWHFPAIWRVASVECLRLADPASGVGAESLAELRRIAVDTSTPPRVRFEAQRVLYLCSFDAGYLSRSRDDLLKLLGDADGTSWGLGSQGAQALGLATEFYILVGEFYRASDFWPRALTAHLNAGDARNYFALKARLAGAKCFLARLQEARREQREAPSNVKVLSDGLKTALGDIQRALASLKYVDPELRLEAALVGLARQLLPNVTNGVFDSSQAASITAGSSIPEQLRRIAEDARTKGLVRVEAEAQRLTAAYYFNLREYDQAWELARDALASARKAHRGADFRLLQYLNTAHQVQFAAKRPTVTVRVPLPATVSESASVLAGAFDDYFDGASLLEKLAFATTESAHRTQSFLVLAGDGTSNVGEEYDRLLTVKGTVHRTIRSDYAAYRSLRRTDPAFATRLEQMLRRSAEFIFAYDHAPAGIRWDDLDFPWARLHEAVRMWRTLSRRTAPDSGNARVTLQQVQSSMREDEVLVDFLRIEIPDVYDGLVAYVYGKSGVPRRLEFTNRSALEKAGRDLRTAMRDADTLAGAEKFNRMSEGVWRSFWAPINNAIQQTSATPRIVYVVPTRELGALPIRALSEGAGKYVDDRYGVSLLMAPSDLVTSDEPSESSEGVLVVGSLKYGGTSVWDELATRDAPRDSAAAARWAMLPPDETTDVLGLYQTAFPGGNVTSLSGDEAREASVKSALSSNAVLHLHSHGFVVENSPLAAYLRGSVGRMVNSTSITANAELHPLLRYGLATSGANRRNDGSPRNAVNADDGILSGTEISMLDLTKVKLAVLSVCDAAVGEYFSNEMMLGLAPSFCYAGARSVLGTVSPVNAAATRRLTVEFHRQLLLGGTGISALRSATKALRGTAVDGNSLDRPAYWAPFVLVGVQRPIFPKNA